MAKIIGNTTATPNPKPDWSQTDSTKANYIKNKPFGTEIITTPVGELYADSGELIADGQMYQYNHSLGIIAGETYMATAYVGETMYGQLPLTALDNSSLGSELPEGVIALCIMESDGSVDTLVGFDNCIVDDGNPIYSNSHFIIGNMDDAITKIVIEGLEGTYERVVYHKLPNEYVDVAVDKTFNPQSLNAQSGTAVEQALDGVTEKFPGSVITQLEAPKTLGDQHIKVSYAGGNSSTHPASSFYNVYTEGIGLNSDLKTTAKDTIVDAINETIDTIDSKYNTIQDRLGKHFPTQTENVLFHTLDDGINQACVLLKDGKVAPGSSPSYLYHMFMDNNADHRIYIESAPRSYSSNAYYNNIIYILDMKTWKIYHIDSFYNNQPQIYESFDLHDVSLHYDIVKSFFEKHTSLYKMHVERYRSSTTMYTNIWLIANNYDGTYDCLKLDSSSYGKRAYNASQYTMTRDFGVLYHNANTPIGSVHTADNNRMTSSFLPTNSEKPGKLEWFFGFDSEKNEPKLCSFGQDDWSNAQIIFNMYNNNKPTFKRALDASGVEQIEVVRSNSSSDYIMTYSNLDNNEHSSYYALDSNNIICLSSSRELLYRSPVTGKINKRVAITTDTDLFDDNLQYIRLAVANNTLFALRKGVLYVIDITSETPTAIKYDKKFTNLAGHDIGLCVFNDTFLITSGCKSSVIDIALLRDIVDQNKPQPDWSQNDLTASDYIQNRPFYSEEVSTDYITLPYSNVDADLGVGAYGKTLGLALNSTYTVDIVAESGTTTLNLVAMELSDASTGISGAIGLTDDDGFVLYDGMVVDADGNFVAGDGVLYEMSDTTVKVLIHGFDGVETVHHKIPTEYVEQGDWDENDQESSAYIKNRTHWKAEEEVDYLLLPYVEPISGLGLGAYGKRIGLELDQDYTIEFVYEGQTYTITATTTEMPKNLLGVVIPNVVYLYCKEAQLVLIDGIEGDFATSTITGTDNCYYTFADVLSQVKIHGVKGRDIVVHKVPNEYLDFEQINTNITISEENIEDQSVTNDKIANGSITGEKLKTPYTLYNLDITEAISKIQQDFTQTYNKIMVRGSLLLNGAVDNFTLSLGTEHNTKQFVITDNPNRLEFLEFIGEITSLGSMLRIDFCYHFGNGGWSYSVENHFITEYIPTSNLDNVSITLSSVTTRQGNITIDCIL